MVDFHYFSHSIFRDSAGNFISASTRPYNRWSTRVGGGTGIDVGYGGGNISRQHANQCLSGNTRLTIVEGRAMAGDRSIAVLLVGILLTGAIFGATVAVGAERTAFDGEYVSSTFEDEGVYTEVTNEIRNDLAGNMSNLIRGESLPQGITLSLDSEEVATKSVTEEFVAGEMDKSIRQMYAFLRGDRDDLDIVIDLMPTRNAAADAITEAIEIDTPELVGSKSDQVDSEQIAQLSEGQQAYQEAQIEMSDAEREEIAAELETNVRTELDSNDEELATAVVDHQTTVLDGLTGEISYDEYVDQLAADEQQMRDEIATAAVREIPRQTALFEEDENPEEELSPFASGIQMGILLSWLLPVLALGLVGATYGLTRSIDRTASVSSVALLIAGICGSIIGILIRPVIVGLFEPGETSDPDPVLDGLAAVVDGSLWTIGMQSLLLVGVGAVGFAVLTADRKGKLNGLRGTLGINPRQLEENKTETESQDEDLEPADEATN